MPSLFDLGGPYDGVSDQDQDTLINGLLTSQQTVEYVTDSLRRRITSCVRKCDDANKDCIDCLTAEIVGAFDLADQAALQVQRYLIDHATQIVSNADILTSLALAAVSETGAVTLSGGDVDTLTATTNVPPSVLRDTFFGPQYATSQPVQQATAAPIASAAAQTNVPYIQYQDQDFEPSWAVTGDESAGITQADVDQLFPPGSGPFSMWAYQDASTPFAYQHWAFSNAGVSPKLWGYPGVVPVMQIASSDKDQLTQYICNFPNLFFQNVTQADVNSNSPKAKCNLTATPPPPPPTPTPTPTPTPSPQPLPPPPPTTLSKFNLWRKCNEDVCYCKDASLPPDNYGDCWLGTYDTIADCNSAKAAACSTCPPKKTSAEECCLGGDISWGLTENGSTEVMRQEYEAVGITPVPPDLGTEFQPGGKTLSQRLKESQSLVTSAQGPANNYGGTTTNLYGLI